MSRDAVVLYVDPDRDDRERTVDALRAAGLAARVHPVESYAAAIDRLERETVGCVVAEYDLGGTTGLALHREVQERWPTVPVVLYTGSGSERVASDALAAGVAAYVPKSGDADGVDLLVERVAETLVVGSVDAHERLDADEHDRLALLVEQAPLGIVEWNLDMTVASWNPAASELFGYDAEEAVGRHATELVLPAENRSAIVKGWQRLVDTGVGSHRVNENLRADGTRITCEWHNAPLVADGETVGVISFVRNVTERRQRRQRLAVLNRVLRHDLRNRMTVIRGSAEEAQKAEDLDTARQFVADVLEEADELLDLAAETRAIERIASKNPDETADLDVAAVVERSVERVDAEDVELSVTTPDRATATVHEAFPAAIAHVVENAVAHNRTEPREASVSVTRQDDVVRVRVADNGPGIPREVRDLLSDDGEITQLRHSRGLGLWIAKWTVQQSGGRLAIEENEPHGTVVTIDIVAARE